MDVISNVLRHLTVPSYVSTKEFSVGNTFHGNILLPMRGIIINKIMMLYQTTLACGRLIHYTLPAICDVHAICARPPGEGVAHGC